MTSEVPSISESGRYSQAEAARLLGVERHALAKWEKSPLVRLACYVRKADGRKYYRGKDLLRIWTETI